MIERTVTRKNALRLCMGIVALQGRYAVVICIGFFLLAACIEEKEGNP